MGLTSPVKEANLLDDLWVLVPGWLIAFYLFWSSFIISDWLKKKKKVSFSSSLKVGNIYVRVYPPIG